MSDSSAAISVSRLLRILLPILAIALAVRFTLPGYEKAAQQQLETNMFSRLLGKSFEGPETQIDFVDEDGDLLCDSPADDQCVTPETLIFSYVGGPSETDEKETWADLIAALGEATSLPAEYRHYASVKDQLAAMASGELHLVGLNTGAIPLAVSASGFHPVCTFGNAEGAYGYTMKLLAPAGASTDIASLRGKQLGFVSPRSNSGFKAAMVYLLSEHNLKPERDYQWSWTYSHEASIQQVAAGEQDAASVASDILARMVNEGEVDEAKLAVLYESERFPPASIGYAHNLAPELREKIATTLLEFSWADSSVAEKYGPSGAEQFVAVSYKDDWANIRRIDEAVATAKSADE